MSLENAPFVRQHLEKKMDSFTVRLTEDFDRATLESCKRILQQSKDSTAIKQLAAIGSEVIHDPKIAKLLEAVTNNKRKNKRMGVVDFD